MGAVDLLVRRGHRRWISNVLLNQVILGACAALVGLILILIAGTDILAWYWILAVLAAGVVAGGVRLRRQIPSRYAVAQAIDRRLGLNDSLSTAWFYSHGGRRASEGVRRAQLAEAETAAAGIAAGKAVPYATPRSAYVMAALGIAASGLLVLRYGISQRLDLRAPLPAMVLDIFHFSAKAQPLAKKDDPEKRTRDLLKELGVSLDRESGKEARESRNAPAAEGTAAERTETTQTSKSPGEATIAQDRQDGRDEREGGEPEGIGIPQAGDGSQEGQEQSGTGAQANGRQRQGNSGENSSLLSKFRDALANIMSRMKPQSRGADAQQSASGAQGRPDAGQGRDALSQQGMQRGSRADGKGMPSSQGRGDQEGEGSDQLAQGGQKSSGSDSREQREGRSGIGKDDGDKSIKEAEQLAAMGKISEILGKRSQNLTGEVMVEVTSGDQKLKTAYSRQSASHAEAGGEIHRDEIPLAYHRLVQQYFEEIRKVPPPREPAGRGAKQ